MTHNRSQSKVQRSWANVGRATVARAKNVEDQSMSRQSDGRNARTGSAFRAIRAIDYTVVFVRDMTAMRRFYEDILGFALIRELSPSWIEYRVGDNTLALAKPRLTAADAQTPDGSASLQLAFKVSAAEVDQCAEELVRRGVSLLSPPTDQIFGHRTVFFVIRTEISWRCSRKFRPGGPSDHPEEPANGGLTSPIR